MRRFIYWLIIAIAIILLLYAIRMPLLKGLAGFLIATDDLSTSEVIFVLSGNAYDRGNHAVELYQRGLAPTVVCTGGNYDGNTLALGRPYLEAELTRQALINGGVDSTRIKVLPKGTSTYEESIAIAKWCKAQGVTNCIVVSSLFHTRRVSWIIKKRLEDDGIRVAVSGAPPRSYGVENWWKSEYGLIDLNNEYVKLTYYLLKYGL